MFEDEYKDGKSSRREYRCRVCDGPVELSIQLVCDECDKRESEEMQMEQEFYSALLGIEEPVYRKLVKKKKWLRPLQAALKKAQEKRGRAMRYNKGCIKCPAKA